MRKFARKLSFILIFASGVAIAAITFEPNQQPYGYIAPPTLSKVNISGGDAVTFVPWFERESFRGDLIAGATSSNGVVNLLAPLWRASTLLDAQDWDLGRKIFTMHPDGYAVPFRQDTLDNDQMKELEDDEDERLDFLRGDRSEEGGKFDRVRESVLGDIIHSNPYYVGVPRAGYPGDGYPAFAYTHRNRPGMVYVGANDGMLHAFDAETGAEKWAYVPSMLFADEKLAMLAEDPYVHQYYVDGPITVEDAQKADGTWYTVLVGGLGAGGRGLFALDITSAATPATETEAATKLMWELSDNDSGNINYTYARTSIVKLNDGKWYAVTGNGYMGSKKAYLLIINLETGALTRQIEVKGDGDNGLSSPTLVDTNKDGKADYAYAGDLNGNMWKFDLTSTSPALWTYAFGSDDVPLFRTAEDLVTGEYQPITTAPEVGLHPTNGLMIYFATGRLFATEDAQGDEGASIQSVYGIRDNNWDPLTLPIPHTALLNQDLRRGLHADSGTAVRTATNHSINWTTHKGWRTDLQVDSPATEEIGERVLQDVILKDGRVQFMSTNPTFATGSNWLMQLNAGNGGAPDSPVIDLSGDRKFSVLDNVDGDASGTVEEVPEDRVVGVYQGFGLISRPSIGSAGSAGDAAILNHLYLVDPWTNPETDGSPEEPGGDTGLIGDGHIDVDTSTEIYAFDDGATNNHDHNWDAKYDLTTVDFFDMQSDGFDYFDEAHMPQATGARFILTVTNAHLSPGGVVEINGIGTPVKEYRALTKRYLQGNLGEGESFPVYKLGPLTPTDVADGVVELDTFRMAFAGNALLVGGVHPTATGCVKGNEPGQNGEYRNGALTIQAVDASNVAPGYTYDPTTNAYHTASNAIHEDGYAFPNNGATDLEDDGTLFWETTIFWHWGGGCFGIDDKDKYDENYAEQVGDYDRGTDADISGDPPPPPPPEEEEEEESEEGDPGFTTDPSTSTVTVSSGNETGRLSWQELIPDNN